MDRHTYEMGLIGNCSYQALIDTKANVQWMCWPKFDSSFIFGGLLDKEKGGEFSVNPHHKSPVHISTILKTLMFSVQN